MNRWRIERLVEDKGFGFIAVDNGAKVFFHASVFGEGDAWYEFFKTLNENDEVELEISEDGNGRLKATSVRLID